MRDTLIVAVLGLCALCAVARPVFGVLAFVAFSILNPHSFAWTFAASFPFAMLLAVSTIVGFVFWSEPKKLPRQREVYLLLFLWSWFVVTCFFALKPDDAWPKLTEVSKILMMVFLSLFLINTRERLHFLIRVIALSLGFFGLKSGIWYVASGGNYMVYGPERSFLEANNAIGLALDLNVPLLYYLIKMEERKWLRLVMWAMLVASYPAVVGTFSRGAWIGLAVATVLMVWRSERKLAIVLVTLALLLVALPLAQVSVPERVAARYDALVNFGEDASAQSRLWTGRVAVHVALANPVFGAGFNYYSLEAYQLYYPAFLERFPGRVLSCHSAWLTVLSEHGFPGFFLWTTLYFSCLRALKRFRREATGLPNQAWLLCYSNMLSVSIITYLVVAAFYDSAYFDLSYQLIAAVIILKEVVRRGTFAEAVPVEIESAKEQTEPIWA